MDRNLSDKQGWADFMQGLQQTKGLPMDVITRRCLAYEAAVWQMMRRARAAAGKNL